MHFGFLRTGCMIYRTSTLKSPPRCRRQRLCMVLVNVHPPLVLSFVGTAFPLRFGTVTIRQPCLIRMSMALTQSSWMSEKVMPFSMHACISAFLALRSYGVFHDFAQVLLIVLFACRWHSTWCAASQQQCHGCGADKDKGAMESNWWCVGLLLPDGPHSQCCSRPVDYHHWPPCHASILESGPHEQQVRILPSANAHALHIASALSADPGHAVHVQYSAARC